MGSVIHTPARLRTGLRTVFVVGAIQLVIGCGGGEGVPDTSGPLLYDCSVFPVQEQSEYALPYDVGTSYEANPHAARTPPNSTGAAGAQYYAVDLLMPIGTPVVAARSGTVVRIEESFADGDNEVGHQGRWSQSERTSCEASESQPVAIPATPADRICTSMSSIRVAMFFRRA